jgi:hypothetical protein
VFSGQANGSILKDHIILPIDTINCIDRCNVYGDYCRAHKCRPIRDAAIVFNLRLKRCFEIFPLSARAYCMLQKGQMVKQPGCSWVTRDLNPYLSVGLHLGESPSSQADRPWMMGVSKRICGVVHSDGMCLLARHKPSLRLAKDDACRSLCSHTGSICSVWTSIPMGFILWSTWIRKACPSWALGL